MFASFLVGFNALWWHFLRGFGLFPLFLIVNTNVFGVFSPHSFYLPIKSAVCWHFVGQGQLFIYILGQNSAVFTSLSVWYFEKGHIDKEHRNTKWNRLVCQCWPVYLPWIPCLLGWMESVWFDIANIQQPTWTENLGIAYVVDLENTRSGLFACFQSIGPLSPNCPCQAMLKVVL